MVPLFGTWKGISNISNVCFKVPWCRFSLLRAYFTSLSENMRLSEYMSVKQKSISPKYSVLMFPLCSYCVTMIKDLLSSCSNHRSKTSEAMVYCVKLVCASVKEQIFWLQRLILLILRISLSSLRHAWVICRLWMHDKEWDLTDFQSFWRLYQYLAINNLCNIIFMILIIMSESSVAHTHTNKHIALSATTWNLRMHIEKAATKRTVFYCFGWGHGYWWTAKNQQAGILYWLSMWKHLPHVPQLDTVQLKSHNRTGGKKHEGLLK